MDPYQHWQHEADFRARAARGEPISKAYMRDHLEEQAQFIDETLSAWWQLYLVGEVPAAALRAKLTKIGTLTHAAHLDAIRHNVCDFFIDAEARKDALVCDFLARLDATEALRP